MRTCILSDCSVYSWAFRVQLTVSGNQVSAAATVDNLGVTVDAQLSMKTHVDKVVRSCFYHPRQQRSVRRSLPGDDALLTLAHAFITNRVDYGNASLYGISAGVTRRLQTVLNIAARLIAGI